MRIDATRSTSGISLASCSVKRRFLVVYSVLAAGLSLAACGDDEPVATTAAPPPPTTGPVTAPPATAAPTTRVPTPTAAPGTTAPNTELPPPPTTITAPPPPTTETGPLRIAVEVIDGVVTGEQRVVVDRGTEIELTVTSNRADEVHIHGYDYTADVDPTGPAVILFVADLPGIYEVELEDAHLLLLELEVR